jgi:hypothetical protein
MGSTILLLTNRDRAGAPLLLLKWNVTCVLACARAIGSKSMARPNTGLVSVRWLLGCCPIGRLSLQ